MITVVISTPEENIMPGKNVKEILYSWDEFSQDLIVLAKRIEAQIIERSLRFDGVFGTPRGGLEVAIPMSHYFDLPFLAAPTSKSLVVEDIADKGESLLHQRTIGCFIATLYYHPQSLVVPDVWLRQKPKDTEEVEMWIRFPWEMRKG